MVSKNIVTKNSAATSHQGLDRSRHGKLKQHRNNPRQAEIASESGSSVASKLAYNPRPKSD